MEIKTFNTTEYTNFLNELPDYKTIRKKLELMEYIKPKRYNNKNQHEVKIEVEYNLTLPRFNKAMISYIRSNRNIPTQLEFFNYYYNDNFNFFKDNKLTSDEDVKAIYNRCMRAYPSLLRDILFGKYLQSKGLNVIHNEILDSKAEIDLLIIGNKGNWGVHLYTNTTRANNHRNDKNYRQQLKFDNVNDIDLGIDLSKCNMINNLAVYEDYEFEQLKQIVAESVSK